MADALDRLFSTNKDTKQEETYTLEEQMKSAEANEAEEAEDFFSDMSLGAKQAFFGSGVQEVTLDTPSEPPISVQPPQPMTPNIPMQQEMPQIQEKQPTVEPKPTVSQEPQEPSTNPINPPKTESSPIQTTTNESVVEEEKEVKAKKKPGRPPRKTPPQETVAEPVVKTETVSQPSSFMDDMFIPLMDQLAKDLIDELRANDYKIARFNSTQMNILYNYMYSKFK